MQDKKPIQQLKIGAIIASIWRNKGTHGNWYSVTVKRAYRSAGRWQFTGALGCHDLLIAAKLLDQAHTRIVKLQQGDHNERKVLESIPPLAAKMQPSGTASDSKFAASRKSSLGPTS